ncbi:tRNA (adenosine(37)-N6)-threonylcarbamoyltransferase complex transferase subunit TsaD [Calditrichota bacterium]
MADIILGIESSCDETGAALIQSGKILSDSTTTQVLHQKYGGVVPELASRAHEKLIVSAVSNVLRDANLKISDLGAVGATFGPGLAGSLIVGTSFAKGIAQGMNIPYVAVNHMEGHLWASELAFGKLLLPALALVISGGHTMLLEVSSLGQYKIIGSTRDDAAGELLDKVGRVMGMGFPAGAGIDRTALSFEGNSVSFPRGKLRDDPYGFSFSGLKTAVIYYLKEKYSYSNGRYSIPQEEIGGVCKGIMEAVTDMLLNGLQNAVEAGNYQSIIVSGGVASSGFLRRYIEEYSNLVDLPLYVPPPRLCTDNASMIAYVAEKYYNLGIFSDLSLPVDPSLRLN